MLCNGKRTFKTGFALPLLGIAVALPGYAMASSSNDLCDRGFARKAATEMDVNSLCGCDTVTTGFIERIQRHKNFEEILRQTSDTCPGLANILIDLPTASVAENTNAPNGEDRDSDESPGDEGDNPGNGGGNTPGDGNEEPGDGDENPGDGDDNPDDGGEDPSEGTEDPSDGTEDPDDGDKDKENNGKKPDDKGDNGHGNDEDGNYNSNPGNSNDPDDTTDDDGTPGNSGQTT
ncbi:MAG: hypothetical protein ACR2O2_17405 [Ruegeria sp.]